MALYLVKYFREGLTTENRWIPVMDSGFVSNDCTKEEIEKKVEEIKSWHDGITGRISNISIQEITEEKRNEILSSDLCFWPRQLEKMAYKASERFKQGI